jgi:benzylsuccinate CoA-transferase BbsF subunit
LQHREALDRAVASFTAEHTAEWLEERLQARAVPVHRVSLSADLFADPQLAARGHFIQLDHGAVGATPCEGSRALFSRTPARIESGAATLGQHNALALGEILGLTDDEISDLVIAGALE